MTATTFMVLTNVNKFVVIIFGVVVLHDELTWLATIGVALAMGGGLWYGRARSRMQEFTPAVKETADKATLKEEEKEMVSLLRGGEGSTNASSPPRRDEGAAVARRV